MSNTKGAKTLIVLALFGAQLTVAGARSWGSVRAQANAEAPVGKHSWMEGFGGLIDEDAMETQKRSKDQKLIKNLKRMFKGDGEDKDDIADRTPVVEAAVEEAPARAPVVEAAVKEAKEQVGAEVEEVAPTEAEVLSPTEVPTAEERARREAAKAAEKAKKAAEKAAAKAAWKAAREAAQEATEAEEMAAREAAKLMRDASAFADADVVADAGDAATMATIVESNYTEAPKEELKESDLWANIAANIAAGNIEAAGALFETYVQDFSSNMGAQGKRFEAYVNDFSSNMDTYVSDFSSNAGTYLSDFSAAAGAACESVVTYFSDIPSSMGAAGDSVVAYLSEIRSNMAAAGQVYLSDASSSVVAAGKRFGASVGTYVSATATVVAAAGESFGSTVGTYASDISSSVGAAGQRFGAFITSGADYVQTTVSTTVSDVQAKGASAFFQELGSGVSYVQDTVTSTVSDLQARGAITFQELKSGFLLLSSTVVEILGKGEAGTTKPFSSNYTLPKFSHEDIDIKAVGKLFAIFSAVVIAVTIGIVMLKRGGAAAEEAKTEEETSDEVSAAEDAASVGVSTPKSASGWSPLRLLTPGRMKVPDTPVTPTAGADDKAEPNAGDATPTSTWRMPSPLRLLPPPIRSPRRNTVKPDELAAPLLLPPPGRSAWTVKPTDVVLMGTEAVRDNFLTLFVPYTTYSFRVRAVRDNFLTLFVPYKTYKWVEFKRRYSEFAALHAGLLNDFGEDKLDELDLELPPKVACVCGHGVKATRGDTFERYVYELLRRPALRARPDVSRFLNLSPVAGG